MSTWPPPAPPRHPGFGADLRTAARAWRTNPGLPVVSLAVAATPWIVALGSLSRDDRSRCIRRAMRRGMSTAHCNEGYVVFMWVAIVMTVVSFGLAGTERVWYLRAFRGKRMHPGEGIRMTLAFLPRYVVLGLAVLASTIPIYVLSAAMFVRPGHSLAALIVLAIAGMLWLLGVDFALTFVTQALAFTTTRVGQAIRIGFREIGAEWPRSAPYVLIPPLMLEVGVRLLPLRWAGLAGALALSLLTTGLNLIFKGATAAFYLRSMERVSTPVEDDGATFVRFRVPA